MKKTTKALLISVISLKIVVIVLVLSAPKVKSNVEQNESTHTKTDTIVLKKDYRT